MDRTLQVEAMTAPGGSRPGSELLGYFSQMFPSLSTTPVPGEGSFPEASRIDGSIQLSKRFDAVAI